MEDIKVLVLEFLNDHLEISISELEGDLGIATGSIRRSGKLPSRKMVELVKLLTDKHGFSGLTKGRLTKKKVTDKRVTDEIKWVKDRYGYGSKYFVPNSGNPTLVQRRFGNYIPLTVGDGIPRYRDEESGLWRRLDSSILNGDGEVITDEVGDYMLWKGHRVYVSFKCIKDGEDK